MNITREVLESYLNCKYNAYLKQTGKKGTGPEYEVLLAEERADVRLLATEKILAGHIEAEVARAVPLTDSTLRAGPLFVLDALLEDHCVSLCYDGLKRVDGASNL